MNTILDEQEIQTADEKLRQSLVDIFSRLPLVPDTPIADIHHFGYAEDNRTFMLMCELADDRTLIVQACPGERLTIDVQ